VRPGHSLRPVLRHRLQHVVRLGGRVLLVDDPPATGSAVRAVADRLQRAGVPVDALSLLLPLFDEELPATLRGYDASVLPGTQWAIHDRLAPDAVRRVMENLLPIPVRSVERLPGGRPPSRRGHLRALFTVQTADGGQHTVAALGAGLGYLGRHALAVARALPGHLPPTYGFLDGLVFREWLPDSDRLAAVHAGDVVEIARYVADRAATLPAVRDASAALAGRLEKPLGKFLFPPSAFTPEQASRREAPGEWNVLEIVGHVIDVERVSGYRMLHIARADPVKWTQVDFNGYAAAANFRDRPLKDIVAEFTAVRASS